MKALLKFLIVSLLLLLLVVQKMIHSKQFILSSSTNSKFTSSSHCFRCRRSRESLNVLSTYQPPHIIISRSEKQIMTIILTLQRDDDGSAERGS